MNNSLLKVSVTIKKKHIMSTKQSIMVAKINKEQQKNSNALYIVICLRTYCYLCYLIFFVFFEIHKMGKPLPNMVKNIVNKT